MNINTEKKPFENNIVQVKVERFSSPGHGFTHHPYGYVFDPFLTHIYIYYLSTEINKDYRDVFSLYQ